jgi:hypothetical protein
MLPGNAGLVLGLIEDWATSVAWWMPYPEGSEDAGKVAFGLLHTLTATGTKICGSVRYRLFRRFLRQTARLFGTSGTSLSRQSA